MTSSNHERTTAEKISIAFDLAEVEDLDVASVLDEMRRQLVEKIILLLNRNPEKLMSILYRIDVSEKRVNEIFSSSLPPDIPEELADLIIERQLQKYSNR